MNTPEYNALLKDLDTHARRCDRSYCRELASRSESAIRTLSERNATLEHNRQVKTESIVHYLAELGDVHAQLDQYKAFSRDLWKWAYDCNDQRPFPNAHPEHKDLISSLEEE